MQNPKQIFVQASSNSLGRPIRSRRSFQRQRIAAELKDLKQVNMIMRGTVAKIRAETSVLESEITNMKEEMKKIQTRPHDVQQLG